MVLAKVCDMLSPIAYALSIILFPPTKVIAGAESYPHPESIIVIALMTLFVESNCAFIFAVL